MENNKKTNMLDEFLDENGNPIEGEVKINTSDKSLVERVNKKIIIEDGRQLLM